MSEGKDPGPYLWLMYADPDTGGSKHADPADLDPHHWFKD